MDKATWILALLIVVAAVWVAPVHAQSLDKGTSVPASVQNRVRVEAINYWVHIDPQNTVLNHAEVRWYLPRACAGLGGCAVPGGCTTLPAEFCWAAVFGRGYWIWGYDWLKGMLIHEFGHLLGYQHGDPVCPMNTEYC